MKDCERRGCRECYLMEEFGLVGTYQSYCMVRYGE